MDLQQRTLRVGLTAILFALVLRISMMDLSGLLSELLESDFFQSVQSYFETGQSVRFSPSLETFSPDFVETPPPSVPKPEEPEIPCFSGEEKVAVTYASSVRPDLRSLLVQPLRWDLYGGEPTVLILHTHTTESYTQKGEGYRETAAYRTLEENYNMLSIGQTVADILTQAGIGVIHDRTVHDYPSYNGSYVHARNTISEYLEQYPTIKLVLDLHRDASEGSSGQLRTVASVEAETSAQLMVVIGTNHQGYQENLGLGLKLHTLLEAQSPGITRPLQLRSQRFNQDLLPGTLLIEVGAAGNSHREAQLAAQQLAKAVLALARGTRQMEEASRS